MAYPVLVDVSDNASLKDIPITTNTFVIGRSLDCNCVLKEFDVSRTHCVLEKSGDQWHITDKSSNGTQLNKQLFKGKRLKIKFGDVISIGQKIKLMFQMPTLDDSLSSKLPGQSLNDCELASVTDSIESDIEAFQTECESENSQKTVINRIIDLSRLDAIFSSSRNVKCNSNMDPSDSTLAGANKPNEPAETPAVEKPVTALSEPAVLQMASTTATSHTNIGLDYAEDELQCSICTEMFVHAVTLSCSHTFCKQCITEWRKNKSFCPICRATISMQFTTRVIDSFIEKIVEMASDEFKQRRQELVAQRQALEASNSAPAAPPTQNVELRTRGQRRRAERPIEVSSDEMESDESESDSDSDTDDSSFDCYEGKSYNGIPGEYYGGYGHCFACGQTGHWANGCPRRFR